MCEKRQREFHDCEYFEFYETSYSGMGAQSVDVHNHCVLKKNITGKRTMVGVRGGFLNECKSKY